MAHATFPVEVLTPDGEVFKDEVEMVSTRTTIGEIGIYAHHTPLLGILDPTELRLYKTETEIIRFAQSEGYIQVTADRVLILVEEAFAPDQLDANELRDKLSRAEQELEAAGEDTEKRRVAARDKFRAEQFLKIVSSE
jgi:F-type H+-transporting ATPase subunit epsilon